MGPSLKTLNTHSVGVPLPHRKRSSRSNVTVSAGAGAPGEHIALIVPMHTHTETHISPPDTAVSLPSPPPSPLSPTDVKAATATRIPLVVKDLNAQAERLSRAPDAVYPPDVKMPTERGLKPPQQQPRLVYSPDVEMHADPSARPIPFIYTSESDAPNQFMDEREQQQRGKNRGAHRHPSAAPPYYAQPVDARVHAQGTLLSPPPSSAPPPPSSRGSRSRARERDAPLALDAGASHYGAKKHVQAFFKAFGDTFEPRMKGVVDRSMDRQSTALRHTIAKHEEEVRDLIRKHDDRMAEVISNHKDEMSCALQRTEYQMQQHLSVQTHDQNVAMYEKELADYFRKRGLGRMLFWAAILGIVVIAVVFNFEIMNGHLGGILGFSISAGYMYLSYRRSLPIRPRRPCPYPGIEGPYAPEGTIGNIRPPWYMNLQRYNPWHREPGAFGLFD